MCWGQCRNPSAPISSIINISVLPLLFCQIVESASSQITNLLAITHYIHAAFSPWLILYSLTPTLSWTLCFSSGSFSSLSLKPFGPHCRPMFQLTQQPRSSPTWQRTEFPTPPLCNFLLSVSLYPLLCLAKLQHQITSDLALHHFL